ncbi:caspase family protein [Embleya sp. NBC_00888]|uniref:caspase, EACC1-associated type n=1 Tax=Embleya sp. NBC_00888 TaxID=2975960 RepID=UPI003863B20F|nr:caspase family protein [Embleya sp. NBC_00888]
MQELPDPTTSRAVVIGAASFAFLPELPAVARNVDGMRAAFCDPKLWGLVADSCRTVLNPEDPDDVVGAVAAAAREARDTLVVYYAGHGLLDSDSPDLHLALRRSKELMGHTALSYQHIRRAVMRSPARRRVVILDCCYSGRVAMPHMSGDPDDIARHAIVEGTYVLTSSARDLASLAPANEQYTAFTGELLELIREGIPNGPDLISLELLYEHLDRRLRARDRPVPQRCGHNTAGLLPLARNLARAMPPPQPAEVTAAEVANTAFEVGVRLATVLHEVGANREAVQILATLWGSRDPAAEPENLRLHLDLAALRAELGQVAEAIEVLEEAFSHAAVRPRPGLEVGGVCLALARLLRETGDYPRACDVLEFAVEMLGGPLPGARPEPAPGPAASAPALVSEPPSGSSPGTTPEWLSQDSATSVEHTTPLGARRPELPIASIPPPPGRLIFGPGVPEGATWCCRLCGTNTPIAADSCTVCGSPAPPEHSPDAPLPGR